MPGRQQGFPVAIESALVDRVGEPAQDLRFVSVGQPEHLGGFGSPVLAQQFPQFGRRPQIRAALDSAGDIIVGNFFGGTFQGQLLTISR